MKTEIKKIINLEIKALQKIIIDENYKKAIDIIKKSRGKVVITGVGKSGIIAQKIAATMSSTGTPALFLHPTDAVHGDLGIVDKNDVVIAISKSGESIELFDMLLVFQKMRVPVIAITQHKKSSLGEDFLCCVIAITQHKKSSLGEAADVVLELPNVDEACPYNLAPTTSTTTTLVIGDALAVMLMKLKKIRTEDFAFFHPGGKLGQRLLLIVEDVMRKGKDNPIINKTRSVKDMLLEITKKRAGAISIVDDKQKLIGFVTDYDIRRVLESGKDIFKLNIFDIMNKTPKYIFSDEKAVNALSMMEGKTPFSVMPVLDKKTKKVVGMVHLHDLISLK